MNFQDSLEVFITFSVKKPQEIEGISTGPDFPKDTVFLILESHSQILELQCKSRLVMCMCVCVCVCVYVCLLKCKLSSFIPRYSNSPNLGWDPGFYIFKNVILEWVVMLLS